MESKIVNVTSCRNASEQQRSRSLANGIDKYIGERLREQRVLNGLSQGAMADLIGVSRKQLRMYENGVNRIGAGRLYAIAQALGVEVGYFFEGVQSVPSREHSSQKQIFLDFGHDFNSMRKRKHKEMICLLTRILAEVENGWDADTWNLDGTSQIRHSIARGQPSPRPETTDGARRTAV